VYAWDLAGAAAAALAVGLVLGLVGGPTAVMVAVAVALLASALFDTRGKARWLWPAAGAALVVLNLAVPLVRVPTTKGVKVEAMRFERWNAFSRVTVDDTETIKIDASAATKVADLRRMNPGMQAREISALGHALFAPPADHVLVIGPGGGRDVLHALAAGANHVTGVEVNPIIADTIMRDRYVDASGGLYLDPRVTIVVDDGRSFVRRSGDRYDVVQASLVDTWAATAAGAFALTENALYTVDAFDDYFDHLTDRGIVTMTRWHTGDGGETARMLLLAAAALERRGVAPGHAREHIFYAVSREGGTGTMIAKREPITADELSRLEAVCKANGFEVFVSPTSPPERLLARYLDAGPYSELVAGADDVLTPPTDDRPFFFYFKRAGDLLHPTWKMDDPGLWIMISLGSVVLLAAAFVIAPLALHWRRTGHARGALSRGDALALGYFALVGLAFMVVEVAMLQRFTLFLGHPSYSLIVVVFSLLLSTALGAYVSARAKVAQLGRVMLVAGCGLAALSAFGGFALLPILRALIGASLPVRAAIAVALVAPSGVLMGAMIPSMVRVLAAVGSPLVPWGWGVNGATSVIGTVIATVVAIYGGFSTTFLLGALAYLGAGVLAFRIASSAGARTSEILDTARSR
jgi:hypothetical protein